MTGRSAKRETLENLEIRVLRDNRVCKAKLVRLAKTELLERREKRDSPDLRASRVSRVLLECRVSGANVEQVVP